MSKAERESILAIPLPSFPTTPWRDGPPLARRRVAIGPGSAADFPGDYRVIPSETPSASLLMSHISVNFDRTGFQQDWNVVFPLDRLGELAAAGTIGSVARTHYSFMGATDPVQMEPHARELAGRLKQDGVDAVILSPV